MDDIIAIGALAFDIDHCHDVSQIEAGLSSTLRPSFIINTGGGLHLVYLLKETINVSLYLPPKTDDEKAINKILTDARSAVTNLGNDFEALLRDNFPTLKIDSMSNVDRVMRLPGTVNYPKAEKRAKGKLRRSCEYIRDHEPLVDNNHWYTHNAMLLLIGAIHDENEYNQLTIEEAFDCFMEAVSGGARYGVMGRPEPFYTVSIYY